MALDALWRLVESATPYELAINVPYALAFTLVAAEVAWLARRPGDRRDSILRSAATATVMALGALAVGVAYTTLLRPLWSLAAGAGWTAGPAFWREHAVLGAVATFVAWDFVGWLYHLIGHRTRVGWAAHQPHHSGEGYNATLGLRQSWAPFHGLLVQPLLALAGFDIRVAFACAAVSNCWQMLEHTSLPVPFPPWFAAHVMTPAAHRHHHGRNAGAVNLGPIFTWWDRLAGTWVSPAVPAPTAYGLSGPVASNPITVELAGWLALGRRQPALRLARKKMATCAATMSGTMGILQLSPPDLRAPNEPRQASPSRASATIHQPMAVGEPRAARGAMTNPSTTVPMEITRKSTSSTMMSAISPPSTLTVSANTGCQPAASVGTTWVLHPRSSRLIRTWFIRQRPGDVG